MMSKPNAPFAATLALLAAVVTPTPLAAGDASVPRMITVTASAAVAAKPDRARVQSGVMSEAETATAATAANTKAMSNLIDGLKSLGIAPKDIQTTNFSVNPRYQHDRDGSPPEINGYQVTNEVSVLIRDLTAVGDILDKMIGLGANQMRGLSFEVSDAETLTDTARTEAVANARRRAELFAKAAGAEVGAVVEIREGSAGFEGSRPMMSRKMSADAVPVEAGEQALTATVTVSWELK